MTQQPKLVSLESFASDQAQAAIDELKTIQEEVQPRNFVVVFMGADGTITTRWVGISALEALGMLDIAKDAVRKQELP